MNKLVKVGKIRDKLHRRVPTLGSWMQIPSSSVAEIMGASGYDWVAIDLEHGAISTHELPDLFRAIELGGTLPLVRLADGSAQNCKAALDAGAGGVIIPMVESASQLERTRSNCCWPPSGTRGVAFSRANLFGKHFKEYIKEAQSPLIVAMIESIAGLENIADILDVPGLDAIFIGPYDLSASMGIMAQFNDARFIEALAEITEAARDKSIPIGIHVVEPSREQVQFRIDEGYCFIAYSIDAVMLRLQANYESY
jgi:2-dehydro-3-deoxyglucarate aldolase